MKTYTIKEIKEKEIWVRVINSTNAKKFIEKCLGSLGNWNGDLLYYKFIGGAGGMDFQSAKPNSFIEFSQIDFEEFILPEKWCIMRTVNNYKIINDWFNKNNTRNYTFDCTAYYIYSGCLNGNWIIINTTINPDYTEITFEQFCKYVLKENIMEKEIIGYKCPINLYGGKLKKGDILDQKGSAQGLSYSKNLDNKYYIPKEIVETWEPVYKQEELKLGEYIIEFKKNSIKVNNQEFDSEELLFIKSHIEKSSDNLVFIKGIKIIKELLQEILNKLKNG